MDPEAFAWILNDWLACRSGSLPQALALDGKMIRDHIGLLTLAQHEDGAPQALAVYDQKEGTERCEQTAAADLLEKLPALDGKIITADPLHCQRKTARLIVEKGGDFLLQIKGKKGHGGPMGHTGRMGGLPEFRRGQSRGGRACKFFPFASHGDMIPYLNGNANENYGPCPRRSPPRRPLLDVPTAPKGLCGAKAIVHWPPAAMSAMPCLNSSGIQESSDSTANLVTCAR